MTSIPQSWSATAFNQVPNSSNKIHSDQIAKTYGFQGGLVPGVTLSAYLVHPAIQAWGGRWLECGYAHVKVESPVYDGNSFFVDVTAKPNTYSAELISEGKRCAIGEVSLPEMAPPAPAPSKTSQTLLEESYVPPTASRQTMEQLQKNGCLAKRFSWHAEHEMASYLRDATAMPAILRTEIDDATTCGWANLSFLLGCANRHFAAVAAMSPWIHIETKSQNFHRLELNTGLISQMKILDLFNKKGHEFADCEFNLFNENTGACICSIWQRAIYKMRGSG